jgi:hypothetical protein
MAKLTVAITTASTADAVVITNIIVTTEPPITVEVVLIAIAVVKNFTLFNNCTCQKIKSILKFIAVE